MKKSTFFLAVCILASYNSFAQRCFSPATYFTTGAGHSGVTTADFNGDGKADLATTHPNSYDLSILIGDGLGGFAAATNIPVGGIQRAITSADFNGDYKMDIAITNDNTDNVSILLGDGSGGFSAATNFAVGTWPNSIVSADFNGDGIIDLATANRGSSNVSVLIGNGSGGFGTATTFTMTSNPWYIIKADFNGDNKMDLATAHTSTNSISVLLGDGMGGFSPAVNVALVGQSPTSLTSDDFNGDGNMDMVAAQGGANKISLLLGNGSGGFSAPVYLTTPGNTNYSITSGDLNEDGKMDLATASANHVVVMLGNGNGGFSSDIMACVAPIFIINADITGDGKKDLVACTNSNSHLAVFINRGFTINLTVTNSTCNNGLFGGNGSISATYTGGLSVPSFIWNTNPPKSGNIINYLPLGTYTVTLTDNNTCSNSASATITGPPSIIASSTHTNISCYGGTNGSASVSVSGGVPPYTYSWNTNPIQTTASINNLPAGNYYPKITDSLGCSVFPPPGVTITEPSPLSVHFEISGSSPNTKCSGVCNGEQNVSADGGTSPYSFFWDAAANNQTTQIATKLCHDNYSLTVIDANGCSSTDSISVGFNSDVNPEIYLTNLAAVDQVNVSPSFSSYYTYNLPSKIIPHASNPRNFVDPGKRARFKVETTNQKSNGQSIVNGICKVRSNSPYITVTDSSSALNNIGWNGSAWSFDEFEIQIDPSTPSGTNAYIDFAVMENGLDYSTSCIAIPIRPLVYSPTTALTIDDDNNPDSQGNDNDICEPNETIEFYPWLDNISSLNAEYVRGRFENIDNHSFITIWNGVAGVGTTVYDATWWNYSFAQPQTINSFLTNTTPEYDFVFDYRSTSTVNDFKLYMVMAGGFNLFNSDALSLVQWSLPYVFNSTGLGSNGSPLDPKTHLNVYPNPSTDFITVENVNYKKSSTYVIFNSIGQQILSGPLMDIKTRIDIHHLNEGTYIIQIGATERYSFKLIKN